MQSYLNPKFRLDPVPNRRLIIFVPSNQENNWLHNDEYHRHRFRKINFRKCEIVYREFSEVKLKSIDPVSIEQRVVAVQYEF